MTSEIIEKQIAGQLEGCTNVYLYTPDLNGDKEPIALYAQVDDHFYIGNFGRIKKLPKTLYEELSGMFTGEQEFNTDPEIIRTDMMFDDFFDKYFNNLEAVNVSNEN